MKFKVQRSALLAALIITGKAIGKSVIPILDNYKFNVSKTSCLITGGSMDIFISKTIEVESDVDSYSICIPSVKLLSLIKGLPDQPLEVIVEEANGAFKVSIIASSGTYNLTGETGKDYPNVPEVKSEPITIDAAKLLAAVSKASFVIDPNINNEPLRHGLLHFGSGIRVVGCNGRMLSVTSVFDGDVEEKQLLISKGALDAITGIAPKKEVKLFHIARNVSMQTADGVEFICQVIDAKFPDYNSVIPNNPDKFMSVDAESLSAAIKRVSLFANSLSSQVIFTFVNGKLEITAEDLDFQESASEQVSCEYTGEDFQIGASAPQVVAFLSKLDSADAYFSFTGQNIAILIRDDDQQDNSNVMLTMPLVIKS